MSNVLRLFVVSSLLVLIFGVQKVSATDSSQYVELELPAVIVSDVEMFLTLRLSDSLLIQEKEGSTESILINGSAFEMPWQQGAITIPYTFETAELLQISSADFSLSRPVSPIPLWMSIIPPLLAIVIALLFKEVFSALFIGILSGSVMIFYYQGSNLLSALFFGIISVPERYIVKAMFDSSHLSIIVFSMVIGGTVSLISRNGGMMGVVNILSRFAKTPRSGQFITWFLGVLIFFDDYANTLVVGNTMRPVTDRLTISREKLAYLVDSTAAPITAIAFVTTWIGAELSYIADGIKTIGLDVTPYQVFLNSLAYSFYPLFALIFMLILIWQKRDFGPMLTFERRVRAGGVHEQHIYDKSVVDEFSPKRGVKTRGINALLPILVIILGTIVGLLYTGWDSAVWTDGSLSFFRKVSIIIGNSDSFKALMWSSMFGLIVAFLLTMGQRILSLSETIESIVGGFKTMLTAILILILAWGISLITEELHTADFISQGLISLTIPPALLPALTFVLAALVAFSTGSSWGTMAVLYPLLLPATWLVCQTFELEHLHAMEIFYNVVSTVLAGAVLGDHCSPISDTTIMSSLACSCNHINHVRTQMPYALSVGAVSLLFGTVLSALGLSFFIVFPLGLIMLFLIVRYFGKLV